eukprot:m.110892 g.110892  ORF g.110892 m.110892 type:complete len:624 (+) comp12759_c0_seq7:82-1953(+)
MLVYVEVPHLKGKTFTLVLHPADTVARLLALCYHTLYDAGVTLGPFVLKWKGKIIEDMFTPIDEYGLETCSFYKEACFQIEEVQTSDQSIAWDKAIPPFVTSDLTLEKLFEERKTMKQREANVSNIFVLLNTIWLLSLFACLSSRWWSGLFPGASALYFLQYIPSIDINNAISLQPPRQAKRWLKNLYGVFVITALAQALIIGLNIWIYMNSSCFAPGSSCLRESVYFVVTNSLLFVDELVVVIVARSLSANFEKKIGADVEETLLIEITTDSTARKFYVDKSNLEESLAFVTSCPNNALVFVDRGLHVDTIAMLPNPIAIDVLHHLCRATLTLNGIARDGSLERISQVINDDRRIPAHSPLRSKLLQVLSRAVPISANFGDQQAAADIVLTFMHGKSHTLTLEGRVHCVTIVHFISNNSDLRNALPNIVLDGFQGLLSACMGDIGDHVPVLLADVASFIRKAQSNTFGEDGDFANVPLDALALTHVAEEIMRYCHKKNKKLATLALVSFNEIIKNEEAMDMLVQPQYGNVWENLQKVLDTSLNSDHEPSRTCAKLLVATSRSVFPLLEENMYPTIQLSLCSALEQAQLFMITHSERQHLLHFLEYFQVASLEDTGGINGSVL